MFFLWFFLWFFVKSTLAWDDVWHHQLWYGCEVPHFQSIFVYYENSALLFWPRIFFLTFVFWLSWKMEVFCKLIASMYHLIMFLGFFNPLPLFCYHLQYSKLWNQVPSLDHFVVQNSGDFLCWKFKEVVCLYVSNLRQ